MDISGDTIFKAILLIKKDKNYSVISKFLITDGNGIYRTYR